MMRFAKSDVVSSDVARNVRRLGLAGSLMFFLGCGGGEQASRGPQHVDIPARDTTAKPAKGSVTPGKESPPGASASKESPFPKVARAKLANGLDVAVTEAHALPIVQIRVLVHAGTGYGQGAGTAELTAAMLKDGGTRTMTSAQLLNRVESLGANLSVDVGFDASTFGMAVTKDHLGDALTILNELVREPRFDEGELKKLKARATDEAEDNARSNGTWTATRVLFRELYSPTNPYATYGLSPSEIAKIALPALKDFHRRFYVPKNVTIVLAGDVEASAQKLVEARFGDWKGGDPPKTDFPPAIVAKARRVVIADRPKSAQSDVFIVNLGPERRTSNWPAVRVANQVLGGGVASRIFNDVREQRSLAYSARSQIIELAHGAQPFVAYAGTATPKTALAAQGLLDNLEKLRKSGLDAAETETARRFLSDIFAIRMETIGSIADLIVQADTLGLPDGYWDVYRGAVRSVDATEAGAAGGALVNPDAALIVVAGDAEIIAPALAHFGEVTIVNPEQDFKTTKTLPANAQAPLEITKK